MIREATENDAGKVSEIYNHYIQNTIITFEETLVVSADFVERIRKVQAFWIFVVSGC